MKKLKVLLSALLLVVITTSCTLAQKREFTNKTFPVPSFSSIKFDAVAKVIYTQSNKVSLRAEGDKEMVNNLDISVKKNVLKIDHKRRFNSKNKKSLTIYISSPTIEAIDVEGVGNWNLEGKIKADNLKIKFEGVGNFEALNLESQTIKADYKGVGNLTLGGSTEFIEIESEGVGSVNTQKLIAKNAVVRSSGVGSVKCYASDSIDLNNNGVGSLTYYGNPTVKNMNNSGVGKIKQGK